MDLVIVVVMVPATVVLVAVVAVIAIAVVRVIAIALIIALIIALVLAIAVAIAIAVVIHRLVADLLFQMRNLIFDGAPFARVDAIIAETLDAITFGGFLAKLDKGSTFRLEQMRVNDDLWAMRQLSTRVTARALLMRFNQGQQIDFRNYRKFSAESRLLEGTTTH